MIKIKLEATNEFKDGDIDSVEVQDTEYNLESTINEYFALFIRVLLGMSFSEELIKEYLKDSDGEIEV